MKTLFNLLLLILATIQSYGQTIKYEFQKESIELKGTVIFDKKRECVNGNYLKIYVTRFGHRNSMYLTKEVKLENNDFLVNLASNDEFVLHYGENCNSEIYKMQDLTNYKNKRIKFHIKKTGTFCKLPHNEQPNENKKTESLIKSSDIVGEWINHWETPKKDTGVLYQNDSISLQKRWGQHLKFNKDGTFEDVYLVPCKVGESAPHKYIGNWSLKENIITIFNLKE